MSAPPGGGSSMASKLPPGDNDRLQQLVNLPTAELIAVLAPLLEQLMERNDKLPLPELTSFHARSKPPLSIHSYLTRFVQYAPMANECYILMLIYLDRISQTNSAFCITALNAHRMIVTGLVLAAKFSQDRYYTNTHYARVGGLPSRELKALELEFLARIHYTLWADVEVIEAYWTQLLLHARRNNLLSEAAKQILAETPVNHPQGVRMEAAPMPAPSPQPQQQASAEAHAAAYNAGPGVPAYPHAAPVPAAAAAAVGANMSALAHRAKRARVTPTPDAGHMQIEHQDTMADYTDENMRYELLRRQQERLRQAQPPPAVQQQQHPGAAPGVALRPSPPSYPHTVAAQHGAGAQTLPHGQPSAFSPEQLVPGAGGVHAVGMPMQQPGAPHNMAAPPVGFPAPGPSFPQPAVRSPSPSASGAAAQLGFPAHNPLAQAFPHHPPGTSLAQGPLLVVQQQAGVHTGPHACPHPGHPGHPGQAPTLQPSPPVGHQPGFGQPAPYPGAAHAAMAGFSPAAGSAPVVAAQYHAGQQLQHQQQAHLSPSHLSPVVRGSPQSQGGSSRSNSLSTSLSNSSLDNISPPQHATSHVYRHLHRQSSKSPYFNPARSPKVNSTSPLALTPRTSLGNAAPPLPVTGPGALGDAALQGQQAARTVSPAGGPSPLTLAEAGNVHQPGSGGVGGGGGGGGSPCGVSPVTSATQSPVVITSV